MSESFFKGIAFPFRFSPTGKVALADSDIEKDFRIIRDRIHQIILTEPGERVVEPEFGCELRELVFEPLDETLFSIIRFRVSNALARWCTEIKVLDIVSSKPAKDSINMFITYEVLKYKATTYTSVDKTA